MGLAVQAMAYRHGAWLNLRLEFNRAALALAFYFHGLPRLAGAGFTVVVGRWQVLSALEKWPAFENLDPGHFSQAYRSKAG
jgi:hypothetical protein